MIFPWSSHDQYESPWSYHVIAWSSCLTMAVNPGIKRFDLNNRNYTNKLFELPQLPLKILQVRKKTKKTWSSQTVWKPLCLGFFDYIRFSGILQKWQIFFLKILQFVKYPWTVKINDFKIFRPQEKGKEMLVIWDISKHEFSRNFKLLLRWSFT